MFPWLMVAAIGGAVSLAGLAAVLQRYRRGEVSGLYLGAVLAGFSSLATYALLSAFRPDMTTGAISLIVLLPAFVAIVLLVREHGKAGSPRP